MYNGAKCPSSYRDSYPLMAFNCYRFLRVGQQTNCLVMSLSQNGWDVLLRQQKEFDIDSCAACNCPVYQARASIAWAIWKGLFEQVMIQFSYLIATLVSLYKYYDTLPSAWRIYLWCTWRIYSGCYIKSSAKNSSPWHKYSHTLTQVHCHPKS